MTFDWRDPYGYMQNYQQPNFPNFQQPQMQNYQQQQSQRVNTNKVFVNGLEGAKTLQLQNTSCVLACDNDLDLLYEITTDATGKRSIRVFDISEHKEEPKPAYATQEEFLAFKKEIQDFMEKAKKE